MIMARKNDNTENAYVMDMFVTKAAVFPTEVPVFESWDNCQAFLSKQVYF
jgi:hypothetical protein